MPRSKPKRASPTFIAHGHPLKDEQKRELLKLLAFDESAIEAGETPGYKVIKREPGAPLLVRRVPENEAPKRNPWNAILAIENALGLGVDGAVHLNDIPRPVDYRREFARARKATTRLIEMVAGWTDYYRDQFTLRGHDIDDIEQKLAALFDVCVDVEREMCGRSSRGAPKQTALFEVIRRLRRIFRDWYCGERTERKKSGAFVVLASWEKAEHDFIVRALRAVPLIPASYSDLPRLLRDRRCALADD